MMTSGLILNTGCYTESAKCKELNVWNQKKYVAPSSGTANAFHSPLENNSMNSFKVFNLKQLSTIIETLSQEAMKQESNSAKKALKTLHYDLTKVFDLGHVQLLAKAQAVLCFLNENYSGCQEIIRRGCFAKQHRWFLQDLYQEAESKKTLKILGSFDYCHFPSSIDSKDKDGLSRSLNKFMENYYISRRRSKKALNVERIAERTGLKRVVVEKKFQQFRNEMSKLSTESKKFKPNDWCECDKENDYIHNSSNASSPIEFRKSPQSKYFSSSQSLQVQHRNNYYSGFC